MNRACFPKEKHPNSQKWAKFMNFSVWPFLWFGLPGRLLKIGCTPRGRTATQRSKIRVLRGFWEGFWERGSQKGSEKGGLFLWVLQ